MARPLKPPPCASRSSPLLTLPPPTSNSHRFPSTFRTDRHGTKHRNPPPPHARSPSSTTASTTVPSTNVSRTWYLPGTLTAADRASQPPAAQHTASTALPADVCTRHLQTPNAWASYSPRRATLFPPHPSSSHRTSPLNGRAVILVEGARDAAVVARAVYAPILCIGGSNHGNSERGRAFIARVAQAAPTVIILTDPDMEGMRLRNQIALGLSNVRTAQSKRVSAADALTGQVPGVQQVHAFVPSWHAVSARQTSHHGIGNVGIEHAQPRMVAQALSRTQLYTGHTQGSGGAFTRELLVEAGLIQGFSDDGGHGQGTALRRSVVCSALGIARSDGTKLLKSLNAYGFSRSQLAAACSIAERQLPLLQALEAELKHAQLEGPQAKLLVSKHLDVLAYALYRGLAGSLARGGKGEGSVNDANLLEQAATMLRVEGIVVDHHYGENENTRHVLLHLLRLF